MKSLKQQLFDAYAQNLVTSGHSTAPDYMLCPLCLKRITFEDLRNGRADVEHIIPRHSTTNRQQLTPFTRLGAASVRSGLTITCTICNRKKGSQLDFGMRGLVTPGRKSKADYKGRSGVAILVYAYLLVFAVYGYEYILQPAMDDVRRQFDRPDEDITQWLAGAEVDPTMEAKDQPIVCNEWGYPFVAGVWRNRLRISFWRFRAILPGPVAVTAVVDIPEAIVRLARQSDSKKS